MHIIFLHLVLAGTVVLIPGAPLCYYVICSSGGDNVIAGGASIFNSSFK